MSAPSVVKILTISIVASVITATTVARIVRPAGSPSASLPDPASSQPDPDSDLELRLDELTERVAQIAERLEAQAAALAAQDVALEQALAAAANASAALGQAPNSTASTPESPSVEAQIQAAAADFEFLGKLGIGAYNHARAQQLIEKLRTLGAEGYALLADELNHENPDRRFAAAAVAEGLKDPALVEPLERSALEDESFIVRRMSSHALAFLGDETAGDSLVRVIDNETRDAGVLLNSWYGLATLGRPEAVTTFARVLDHSGGDLPADFVVDTALKIPDRDERLLGAFELALGRASVSLPMKSRVLSTLARSNSAAARQVIQRVADDESAPAELRAQAQQILTGG
ncbi:MAG: HEAT repeat domain-containing protein [Planctomycetota bacterium]